MKKPTKKKEKKIEQEILEQQIPYSGIKKEQGDLCFCGRMASIKSNDGTPFCCLSCLTRAGK